MTGDKPPPSAASSGPIARELAEWLRAIRSGWTESVPEPFSIGLRRFYACAGSFTCLVGFVLVLRRNPLFEILIPNPTLVFNMLVLYSLLFGWLVAFAERRAGPVRLFLDGVILPAATVSIIVFSGERVWSTSAEPEQSSSAEPEQSSPVTLSSGSSASDQSSPEVEEAGGESSGPPEDEEVESAPPG